MQVTQPYKCLTEVQNLQESLQEIGMATMAGLHDPSNLRTTLPTLHGPSNLPATAVPCAGIIRASSLSDIASSSVASHSTTGKSIKYVV